MSETFIKEIEIKNYKCFKNFKAESFARVNLIGGKNNVGKTAFMEALYLIDQVQSFYNNNDSVEREKLYFEVIKTLIDIQQNRYGNSFLIAWILDNYTLNNFSNFEIELPEKYKLSSSENEIMPERFQKRNYWNDGTFTLFKHQDNKYFYKIKEKNKLPIINILKFITLCNNEQKRVRVLLSKIKKNNKNNFVNKYLKNLFDIDKIDLTDEEVILFSKNKAYNLSEYGDGVKNFINIILTILYHKNTTLFMDEIENGIHYTKLDEMWRLILKLSKENNVQVFATTHSKECIESYARVAKELEEKDISFISFYRNKKNNIKSIVFNRDDIDTRLELGLDNR